MPGVEPGAGAVHPVRRRRWRRDQTLPAGRTRPGDERAAQGLARDAQAFFDAAAHFDARPECGLEADWLARGRHQGFPRQADARPCRFAESARDDRAGLQPAVQTDGVGLQHGHTQSGCGPGGRGARRSGGSERNDAQRCRAAIFRRRSEADRSDRRTGGGLGPAGECGCGRRSTRCSARTAELGHRHQPRPDRGRPGRSFTRCAADRPHAHRLRLPDAAQR